MLVTAATLCGRIHVEKVALRLSNLMAYDADAFGTWGCPPHLYPEAVGWSPREGWKCSPSPARSRWTTSTMPSPSPQRVPTRAGSSSFPERK